MEGKKEGGVARDDAERGQRKMDDRAESIGFWILHRSESSPRLRSDYFFFNFNTVEIIIEIEIEYFIHGYANCMVMDERQGARERGTEWLRVSQPRDIQSYTTPYTIVYSTILYL